MGRLWCVGVACVVLALPARAAASPAFDKEWPAVVRTLRAAEIGTKGVEYREALTKCRELLKSGELGASERATLEQASTFAIWRYTSFPMFPTTPQERDRLLNEASQGINQVLMTQPDNAEALVLRVSVLSAMMRFNPVSGVIHGSKTVADMQRALKVAPRNPRVLLANAVRLFQTPKEFGGDPVQAEAQVRQALQMFQVEPPDRPWPNWGRTDAHIWLGLMLARRGDTAGAKAEYEKALKVTPNHFWGRSMLRQATAKPPQTTGKPQK